MHTYIPIFRPYDSESRLLERFAVGFEQFDQFESVAGGHGHLLPLIEVTSTDVDLVNLEGIRGDLLVDFPQYLTERSTRFDEDLEEFPTTDIARAEILVRIVVLAVLLETAGIDEEKGREILDDKYSRIDGIIELS